MQIAGSSVQNIYPVLFNHYLEPSLLADSLTGEILEANQAAVRFLRRPPTQLIGQPLTILLPTGQENALDGFLESIRIDGRTQNAVELQLGSGETASSQIIAQSIDMGGSATLLVTLKGDQRGSLSDTTDTKVNQLQHHIQSIQELCSGLNNPIQELLSTVELQGNLRLKRVAETSSSILRKLRHLENPPGQPRSATQAARVPRKTYGKPCTQNAVLIVDDDTNVRNLFNNILRIGIPNIELEMANDGQIAVEAFKEHHHELVLLEHNMPRMGGEAAYVQIEAVCREKFWEIPTVIICTGFDGKNAIPRMLEKDDRHTCLFKPVLKEELIDEVNRCLARPEDS